MMNVFGHIRENHKCFKTILIRMVFLLLMGSIRLLFFIKEDYNKNKGQRRSKERLDMDINQMTEKVQTAIMNAQSIAIREQHQEVDEVHLFLALLEDEGSLISSILEKTDVNVQEMKDELQENASKKPRVSGEWGRARKTVYYE